MPVTDQSLNVFRGEDVARSFDPAEDEDATSNAAWTILFTVTTTAGVSALTRSATGASTGVITVTMTAANTASLTASTYRWDLWRTDTGSNQRLAGGTLTVSKSARYPS